MSNENDSVNSSLGRDLSDDGAMVTLTIPCTPEYVGTARLTILGVASRMGFSYDQVEDIRLAVGEACANAIERASHLKVGTPLITIRSLVETAKLTVEVEDHTDAPAGEGLDTMKPAAEIESMNSQELGALLMEILVDEVSVEPTAGGGTLVRLVKFANEA